MDYLANVENSEIDVSGIRTVLVQGDASYPVIRFILDPSLTGLSWRVRGTYLDTLIPVLSPEIIPVESESSVILDWSVSSDFTTHFGNMQLVVVGANDSGTVITKALGEVTIQRDYSIGTMAEITLNLFEQLMAQLPSLVNHNDFNGIQGGSENERYHLTAAEHTVIENTSGINTGDQDVSGAISTHNANTSAHADKEKTSNKVTSLSSASTDVQYPSAKCTYGAISTHNSDADAHQSIQSDIASLNNDIVAVKRIVNLVYINNSYIGAGGTIVSAANFRRTEPFELNKGDVVRIDAKGYTDYLAILARYADGVYSPLIVSDSMDQKVYTYSIAQDGYYVCSFQTAGYFELSVTIYSSELSDRISALEEFGASEYTESPIMTNGKYVNLYGNESTITWGSVTDYLSVDGLKSFYTALRTNVSVCYYDKNKVFISGFDAQTIPTVGTWYNAEPPQGAKYIRISAYSTIVPQIYVKYSMTDALVEHDRRLTVLESGGERESNILSMYDTFIFIGDSLTWSQVYTSDTNQRRAYKTYPQVFASLCDGESYAFATPGDTALLWWQRSSAGAFDRHGLYIVFLGTNMELTDTIDTDCPGTDPDGFAQTQTGQYGRILQIISNNGDHAVLIKPWGGGGGNLPGTRAVIDAFAEKYNFATIGITSTDRTTPAYHYWPNKEGSNGLHFNELGYAWLANEVYALINGLPAEDKFKIMRTQ